MPCKHRRNPGGLESDSEGTPLRRTSCERGADVLQARGVRHRCRRQHGPGRAGSMAKSGEIDYLKNLSPADVWHAVHKPFSDDNCAGYLFNMGAVFSLLPPRPARLLDLGCGTGWTSIFFARAGYD